MNIPPSPLMPSPTLPQTLQRLDGLVDWERLSRRRMQVDTLAVADLLARLGDPQKRFRSVHVTGTKGKGSICSLVVAGLRHHGFRVGRYTSPHLEVVNERIHIDERPIDDDALAAALSLALDAMDGARASDSPGAHATWFDVLTATAFVAFARAGVTWTAVEVGIGGRLDSTNVLSSDVAVITNVGLEHTDVLGDTVEVIAAEKAGIIKSGTTLVTPIEPSSAAGAVIFEVARRCGASVRRVTAPADASVSQLNVATAREVLDALGSRDVRGGPATDRVGAASLPDDVAVAAAMPGRMERFLVPGANWRTQAVVLDGAHVDFALQGVLSELRRDPALQQPPIVLLALGADKNARAMLTALRGSAAHVICVPLDGARACWSPDHLREIAESIGIAAETAPDAMAGLQRCLQREDAAWVLVTGSLHLVGRLRQVLVVG